MAVEEGQLLSAVSRIVGGVQVDREMFDLATSQPLAMPLDATPRQDCTMRYRSARPGAFSKRDTFARVELSVSHY